MYMISYNLLLHLNVYIITTWKLRLGTPSQNYFGYFKAQHQKTKTLLSFLSCPNSSLGKAVNPCTLNPGSSIGAFVSFLAN